MCRTRAFVPAGTKGINHGELYLLIHLLFPFFKIKTRLKWGKNTSLQWELAITYFPPRWQSIYFSYSVWIRYWLQVALCFSFFSHLLLCVTRSTGSSGSCYECLLHTGFLKSPVNVLTWKCTQCAVVWCEGLSKSQRFHLAKTLTAHCCLPVCVCVSGCPQFC